MFIPNDPLFANQWWLYNTTPGEFDLRVVDIWTQYTGAGVQIAVMDDGVEGTHPDIDGNYSQAKDFDFETSSETMQLQATGEDADYHGTAVAGIIGAETNNGIGVAGVAFGSTVFGFKNFLDAFYIAGLNNAAGSAQQGGVSRTADIVNMSFGVDGDVFFDGGTANTPVLGAIANAVQVGRGGLGTILVKSAGNARQDNGQEGADRVVYDTDVNMASDDATPHTISVAAVQRDGNVDSYSSHGSSVLVSAFGSPSDITTLDIAGPNGYSTTDYASDFNGTSASAPMVSGVVALMLQANASLGWRDVQDILAHSARHVGSDVGGATTGFEEYQWIYNGADTWNGGGLHFSNDYGFGLVDAKAAVRLAETWGTNSQTSANERTTTVDLLDLQRTLSGDGLRDPLTAQVTQDIIIESVQLKVNFPVFADYDDLTLHIIAPDGTRSIVYDQFTLDNNEQGGPFGAVQWDYFISHAFRDMSSAGNWTVEFRDMDTSTTSPIAIDDVQLVFNGKTPSADKTYIFTSELSDVAPRASHQTSVDGGAGTDTINAAAVDTASVLNLSTGSGTIDGVSVNLTNMENVYTGESNDRITGNEANNQISTGLGIDSFAVNIASTAATVSRNTDGTWNVAGEGNDRLANVERIVFTDGMYALDVDGLAGQVYRLYQAAFAREPDDGGVTFWISQADGGQSLLSISQQFTGTAEYQQRYGANPTNDALVAGFYQNVLGREGETGGVTFWTGELNSGNRSVAQVLSGFSESPENVQTVGQTIGNGFLFGTEGIA